MHIIIFAPMMIAVGFLLGFLGYLPLGNINLTVVQLALDEPVKKVWVYILFVALMEFVYCVACMLGMNVLLQEPFWVFTMKCLAVIIFLGLGWHTFSRAEAESSGAGFSGIGKGIFIAVVNPLQIPFWLIWGVYVIQNKWVQNDTASIINFGVITSLGTISVLWLYAVAGKKLIEAFKVNRVWLNRFIGLLFIGLAVLQIIQLIHRGMPNRA